MGVFCSFDVSDVTGQAVGQNIAKVLAVLEPGVRPEVEPEAVLQTLMAVSFVLTHSEQTLADVNDLPQVINTLCSSQSYLNLYSMKYFCHIL